LRLGSDLELRLDWREVRLQLTREQLERVLNQPWTGATRDMTEVLREIGPVTLISQPTLGGLTDQVNKLRPNWRVGDWNIGISEEAIGRSLLDTLGVKPWTTGDDKPITEK
jgi:hypothetical protein